MSSAESLLRIAVFFSNPDPLGYPFSEQMYIDSYRQLGKHLLENGCEMIIVRSQDSYVGNGVFAHGWKIESDPFQEVGEFRADLIFDRKPFQHDGTVPRFNHPDLHQLCSDKETTYARFPNLSPSSTTVSKQAELPAAVDAVSTELVVIKPVDGEEGKGVEVLPHEQARNYQVKSTVIVQEFLDTSGGVPGVIEGPHDLRVAVLDGEIAYSYVRTPPPGKFTANVAQGGSMKTLSTGEIPEEVRAIVSEIDAELAYIPHRFYGVDFGLTPNGPKIIEMNSRLGLLPDEEHQVYRDFKINLAKVLAAASRGE